MVWPRLDVWIDAARSSDRDATLVCEAKSCEAVARHAVGIAEKSDTYAVRGALSMQRERKDNHSEKQSGNNEGYYSHRTYDAERPKLSDPAHERVRLQPERDGRVRCRRMLDVMV